LLIEIVGTDGSRNLLEITSIQLHPSNNGAWDIKFHKDNKDVAHVITCPDKTSAQFKYDVLTAELRSQIICEVEHDVEKEREQRQQMLQQMMAMHNARLHQMRPQLPPTKEEEPPKYESNWFDQGIDRFIDKCKAKFVKLIEEKQNKGA
jgi:hypothetical protein